MSHHKNHAGTFPNRAAASHESDYKDEYSDHDQKRGWRKIAWIQEMRKILVNGINCRADRYYHHPRQLQQKINDKKIIDTVIEATKLWYLD